MAMAGIPLRSAVPPRIRPDPSRHREEVIAAFTEDGAAVGGHLAAGQQPAGGQRPALACAPLRRARRARGEPVGTS
jgi:hypothetical protein